MPASALTWLAAAQSAWSGLSPVDEDLAALQDVDLCAFSIILVLTGKLLICELIQDLADACGGFCQHGLYRDSWNELYMLRQILQQ